MEEVMDRIALDNAICLLHECLENGLTGSDNLWAWFIANRDSIESARDDLIFEEEELDG